MRGLSKTGADGAPVVVSVILLSTASLAGCGSDATGVDGLNAEVGSVEITAVTTGSSLDPDGYTARVGNRWQSVGVNGAATLPGLAPGDHDAELIGLTSNCRVTGANPLTVRVVAGETASASFEVACEFVDLEALGKIAFTRDNGIWVMEGHGGNPVRLTRREGGFGPVWAPDGMKIAFTRGDFDFVRTHVWVMDADGSHPANLTNDSHSDGDLAWGSSR